LRIELVDADMRERMATDLMTAIVQRAHLVAIDHPPIRVHVAEGPAGNVKGAADAVLFEDCGAVGEGGSGNVIESEADKRRHVAHRERL
jgi:hypothetical protein